MSSLKEDAQPNEIRLARKGVSGVPVVRSSKPVYGNNRGGNNRGRGSWRGRGRHWHRGGPSQSPHVNASAGPSGSAPQPESAPRQDLGKRPAPISEEAYNARKKPRPSMPIPGPSRQQSPQPRENNQSKRENGKPWTRRKRKQKLVGIIVDIPPSLSKDVADIDSRRRWLQEQITILESTKNVQVINHGFPQQGVVRFGCLPNNLQKKGIPPPNMTAASPSGLQLHASPRPPESLQEEDPDWLDEEPPLTGPSTIIQQGDSGELGTVVNLIDIGDPSPPCPLAESSPQATPESPLEPIAEPPASHSKKPLHRPVLGRDLANSIGRPAPKLSNLSFSSLPLTSSQSSASQKLPQGAPANTFRDGSLLSREAGASPLTQRSPTTTSTAPNGSAPASSGFSFSSGTLTITTRRPMSVVKDKSPLPASKGSNEPPGRARNDSDSYVVPQRQSGRSSPEVIVISDDEESPEQDIPMVLRSSPQSDHNLGTAPDNTAKKSFANIPDAARVALAPEIVQCSLDIHDKPRRLVIFPDIGIVSVTLRGSVELVDSLTREVTPVLTAGDSARHLVDDACLLKVGSSDVLVVGHARDAHPFSLFEITESHARHITSPDRPVQPQKKGGVSAVCAMLQPGAFATGGYDHMVHLWTVSETGRHMSAPLAIKHSSVVQALLPIRDSSHKLVAAGADCIVNLYDLSSERVVNTLRTSNSVYHVHESLSPFCTLLEVAHRELQFEVRDHRWVPQQPVQRFGYITPKLHGRYMKGAFKDNIFACGDREGSVRLWDLRNLKRVAETITLFEGRKIIQTTFSDKHLVVLADNHRIAFHPVAQGST